VEHTGWLVNSSIAWSFMDCLLDVEFQDDTKRVDDGSKNCCVKHGLWNCNFLRYIKVYCIRFSSASICVCVFLKKKRFSLANDGRHGQMGFTRCAPCALLKATCTLPSCLV
jgi:hypothetical protein